MRDGRTRKLEIAHTDTNFEKWLARWRAAVVLLSGDAAGTEYELEAPSVSLGRGDSATWTFSDEALSKEHAALEFASGAIRLRDLGSMNGSRVNGAETKAAELKNGDRFELGGLTFQFVIEKRRRNPRTYVVDDG
ncbi:MAG: FHA domain-containing protein [Myxococcota bacterium]|nr:FHA domain-containing protein [Myxococcota bacterium]